MDSHDEDLLERIYTAGLIPEVWPDVVDRMARRMNAKGGSIFTLSDGQLSWDAPASTRPIMEAYIADGWAGRNPRLDGLLRRAFPGFIQDIDVCDAGLGDYASLPVVKDFLRPHDIYRTAATVISGARNDLAVFSVDRGRAAGDFSRADLDWLDAVRPHLSRSVALASRLKMRLAATATEALGMVGIPAAISRKGRGIVATNALFDALVGRVFHATAFGQVALADREADRVLQVALAPSGKAMSAVRSIPVRADGEAVGVLHLIPAHRQASDILGADGTLIVLAQIREDAVVETEWLRWLYDLSPTEAIVASRLCAGLSMADIAAERSTSAHTVRTQMKSIFRKTGFSRQADFIRAVSSLSALGPIVSPPRR